MQRIAGEEKRKDRQGHDQRQRNADDDPEPPAHHQKDDAYDDHGPDQHVARKLGESVAGIAGLLEDRVDQDTVAHVRPEVIHDGQRVSRPLVDTALTPHSGCFESASAIRRATAEASSPRALSSPASTRTVNCSSGAP